MVLGHMPKNRAKSPIIELKQGAKYPEMRRNGDMDGSMKINRIELRGTALVRIRNAESPSCIWVELPNNITDQLTLIEPYNLKKLELESNVEDIIRAFIDQYAMAPREERIFNRARILDVQECEGDIYARVIFIDHGDSSWVNVNTLCELPKDFLYHPWQVTCLSVSDLEKVNCGRNMGEPQEYWSKEDCDDFKAVIQEYDEFSVKVLLGSVIRNDYQEPIKVEMYGIDDAKCMENISRKKVKGQNIACRFAAKTNGRVRYIDVDDASKYPVILSRPVDYVLGKDSLPLYQKFFPEDWDFGVSAEPAMVSRSDWDKWSIESSSVPIADVAYAWDKYRDKLTESILIVIEGTCTQSPYEFYGRFLKRIDKTLPEEDALAFSAVLNEVGSTPEEQEKLGDISLSMLKADQDLKKLAESLDAFYGKTENRVELDTETIKEWLEKDTRVYAVTSAPEERAIYTGEWQRVEILSMDVHANVRYLDSGGTDTVAAKLLYRLHPDHTYHPLCVQLCLHGVCDPDLAKRKEKGFSMKVRRAFSGFLRVDVPLMVSIIEQRNKGRRRKRGDKPFELDNVLFVSDAKMMGDDRSLADGMANLPDKNMRVTIDRSEPIPLNVLS